MNTNTQVSSQKGFKNISTKKTFIPATDNLVQYFVNRDWTTAELSEHDVGKTVKMVGWLNEYNNANKQFQQLKDGYGIIQVVASRPEVCF